LLQVHGDEDSVVHYSWGKMSFGLLQSFITDSDRAPAFVTIDGMGHSSDKEEIAAVKQFLIEVLRV
jgi:predicted esterase